MPSTVNRKKKKKQEKQSHSGNHSTCQRTVTLSNKSAQNPDLYIMLLIRKHRGDDKRAGGSSKQQKPDFQIGFNKREVECDKLKHNSRAETLAHKPAGFKGSPLNLPTFM